MKLYKVIRFFLKFFFRPAEKKHARVKNWTKKVDLFEKDFIFVPINEQWVLSCVFVSGLFEDFFILFFVDGNRWTLKWQYFISLSPYFKRIYFKGHLLQTENEIWYFGMYTLDIWYAYARGGRGVSEL